MPALNYITADPYVQTAFLALIGLIVVTWFVNRRWTKVEENDFKREQRKHQWAVEDEERKKASAGTALTIVKEE